MGKLLKMSRMRLYWSIVSCEGLFASLLESVQYSPPSQLGRSQDPSGISFTPGLPEYYDYAGSMHVHSTYSDGAGSVAQIARAANDAGLDFVVLCDHQSLQARHDARDGWYGGTLMVVGTEITTDSGHLLAMGVPDDFDTRPGKAPEIQKRIVDTGGLGFIALPCDLKDHWKDFGNRHPAIGLEVFNLSAIARTKINLPALAIIWRRYHGRRPQRAFHIVSARPVSEIRLWDSLIVPENPGDPYRPVVGIASVDAHAIMKFAGMTLPFPTYGEIFRTLRTHVLLREALAGKDSQPAPSPGNEPVPDREHHRADASALESAIGRGHCYMAYDNYADSAGFLFTSVGPTGAGLMGDSVTLPPAGEASIRLIAQAPKTRSIVRLYRNGRLVAAARGGRLEHEVVEPGAYRVEVFLYRRRLGNICFGARPWIFSNPIYVQPAQVQPESETTPGRSAARVN
jgi:hypothetical protein